jgi:hypothetical protein
MNGHELKVGDELIVSRAGAEISEGFSASVHEVLDHAVVLEAGDGLQYIRPGVLLTLKSNVPESSAGFAAVEEVTPKGEGALLRLTKVRWQNTNMARAQRVDMDCRAIVSYVEGPGKETKRTVGQAINLSLTGVRIRLRTPLPANATVHIQVFLPGDQPFSAVAKVARIVEGTEAGDRGYELGLSFIRFMHGYDKMAALVSGEGETHEEPAAQEPPAATEPAA